MEEINLSIGGTRVIFVPNEVEPPERLRGWTLYDVYVEGEHMGLVTDTGDRPSGRDETRVWRTLTGNAYEVGDALSQDEVATNFVRWYYGSAGGSAGVR